MGPPSHPRGDLRRTVVACAAMMAAALVAFGAAAGDSAGIQDGSGAERRARIHGTVRADNGAPVRRATVTLRGADKQSWSAFTDAQGQYELPAVPAGRYDLKAEKPGFVMPAARDGSPPAGALVVRQVDDAVRADLVLARGAAFEGRVHDQFGDPSVEAVVEVHERRVVEGVTRLVVIRRSRTNDLGAFRVYGLRAGKYLLSATADRTTLASAIMEGGVDSVETDARLAPTFYPGVMNAQAAQWLQLGAGEELAGLDFGVTQVLLADIAGTVLNSAGHALAEYVVLLNPARDDGAQLAFGSLLARTDGQGRFRLSGVAPGPYRLDVRAAAEVSAIGHAGRVPAPAADSSEFASQPVTLDGRNIESLTVRTSTGHSCRGRVIVEGAPASARTFTQIRVSALEPSVPPGVSAVLLNRTAIVSADGSFDIHGLLGPRLFRIAGAPTGWALKAVRMSGTDVTDAGVTVSSNLDDLEVVITAQPSRVTGTVTKRGESESADATVVIFSRDRAHWSRPYTRYVVTARPDVEGRFVVTGLPTGQYFAIARPGLLTDWSDPAVLEEFTKIAVPVAVSEGLHGSVRLVPGS